jgi:hypothetical protein
MKLLKKMVNIRLNLRGGNNGKIRLCFCWCCIWCFNGCNSWMVYINEFIRRFIQMMKRNKPQGLTIGMLNIMSLQEIIRLHILYDLDYVCNNGKIIYYRCP